MSSLLNLLRGSRGHPSHPPLTDLTIGAYTIGTILAALSWLGIAEERTGAGALPAVVIGLVSTVPTVLTGLLDYLRLRRRTPVRTTANIHWITMVSATAVFAVAALLLRDASGADRVSLGALLVTVGAWLLLVLGGWVGGTLAYVYGVRVVGEPGTPTREALTPKFG